MASPLTQLSLPNTSSTFRLGSPNGSPVVNSQPALANLASNPVGSPRLTPLQSGLTTPSQISPRQTASPFLAQNPAGSPMASPRQTALRNSPTGSGLAGAAFTPLALVAATGTGASPVTPFVSSPGMVPDSVTSPSYPPLYNPAGNFFNATVNNSAPVAVANAPPELAFNPTVSLTSPPLNSPAMASDLVVSVTPVDTTDNHYGAKTVLNRVRDGVKELLREAKDQILDNVRQGIPARNPTEEELNALGFNPLELVTIENENGSVSYIKALSKGGFKVLIELDNTGSDLNTDAFANVRLNKVVAKIPLVIPETYHDTCRMCTNQYMSGVAYQRGDSMCRLRGEKQGEIIIVKEELYSTLNGTSDPNGLFQGDAAPFPIVKLSALRAHPALVHCEISRMTKEIVAALLKADLIEIKALKAQLELASRAVAEYEACLYDRIYRLNCAVKRLEAHDAAYDRIKICETDAAEILARRGQLWDNLTHRQLMWGHLIENATNVAMIRKPVEILTDVILKEKAILEHKSATIDTVIEISYSR